MLPSCGCAGAFTCEQRQLPASHDRAGSHRRALRVCQQGGGADELTSGRSGMLQGALFRTYIRAVLCCANVMHIAPAIV